MFQFTGSGIGFAMALMPILIIWYLSTAEVKAVFAEGDEPAPAPSPAPTAAPAAFAAAAAPAPAAPAPPPIAAPAVVAAAAAAVSPAPAEEPVAPPVMAAAAPASEAGPPAHHMKIEDVEGMVWPRREASRDRYRDDERSARSWCEAVCAREDRRADRHQQQAHPRLGEQGRPDARPGRGPQYSDLLEAAGVDCRRARSPNRRTWRSRSRRSWPSGPASSAGSSPCPRSPPGSWRRKNGRGTVEH